MQPILTDHGESVEICAESFELAAEVGVTTVDQGNTLHIGWPLGGERRNQVAETAAQIRHINIAPASGVGPKITAECL